MVIQYILAPICVAALVGVWLLFKRRRVSVGQAWSWSAIWTLGLAVVLFPDLASRLAAAVGVGRGTDVVVYAAVILLFYLIFRIYLRLDRMERDITVLVRRLAVDQANKTAGQVGQVEAAPSGGPAAAPERSAATGRD